jgi:hypothetical protein
MKILEVDGIPVPHEHETEVKPISTNKKIQILKTADEDVKNGLLITISRPIKGISISGDKYLLDESGKPLGFETIKEMIQFFADRNYTIMDLLDFDITLEKPGRKL